jgi:hypothetical protein
MLATATRSIGLQEISLPPLVVDLPLLLSPFGPWLVQRLAQTGEVWLPRAFLILLEEMAGGEDNEALAATLAAALGDNRQDALEQACQAWREAWPSFVQTLGIYWLGDALDVSHVRKGLPAGVMDRFDELVQGLDAATGFSSPGAPAPLLDAARDALALAAALSGERALVLSAALRGYDEPAVVTALDRFGIAAHRLEPGHHRDLLLSPILRRLEQAQVLGLLVSGMLRLGLIHLCVPRASRPIPVPRPMPGGATLDELGEDDLAWPTTNDDQRQLWEGAVAVWHDIA